MGVYIDDYFIDAALKEGHTYASEVTKYPVESGSDITDNIRNKPIVVTIEGIVSDSPIGQAAVIRNRSRTVDPTVTSTNLQNPNEPADFLPSDEALAKLLAIRNAQQPVVVSTSLTRYDSMVLTNLEIPRDAETGAALHFTATFEQVIIVTNNRVNIRVASPNMGGKTNVLKDTKGFQIVDQPMVTTLSGKTAIWDPKKARYVYGSSLPGGAPVPNSDMPGGDATQGPGNFSQPIDNTGNASYNSATQRWENPDGSAATQNKLHNQGLDITDTSEPVDSQPWWASQTDQSSDNDPIQSASGLTSLVGH